MTVRGVPAPHRYSPFHYWEDRAQRFASEHTGLAAVCAYGMPEFYNRAIDIEQRLALAPWLAVDERTRVLDVGCGIGRWSRLLATRGAHVCGIDLSPTMIAQARRRAEKQGFSQRCHFSVADLTAFNLGQKFDLVLAVTVLQHIVDPAALKGALSAMAGHLAPGGRIVLLEAAPIAPVRRCDTTIFVARERSRYLELFESSGLELLALTGVDPAPLTKRLLPHLRNLPSAAGLGLLALLTAFSLPINVLFGRRAVKHSWHAVFILQGKHRES